MVLVQDLNSQYMCSQTFDYFHMSDPHDRLDAEYERGILEILNMHFE